MPTGYVVNVIIDGQIAQVTTNQLSVRIAKPNSAYVVTVQAVNSFGTSQPAVGTLDGMYVYIHVQDSNKVYELEFQIN